MTDTDLAPGLGPEQLEELMGLLKDSDSVELKLTVPDEHQRSAVQARQRPPRGAEVPQFFFSPPPDLTPTQRGVAGRARRTTQGDDSVVKLRPVVPSEISADLRSMK